MPGKNLPPQKHAKPGSPRPFSSTNLNLKSLVSLVDNDKS